MTLRYVTQRDLDGSWSVRHSVTGDAAVVRGKALVGLTEKRAANRAMELNALWVGPTDTLPLRK